MHWKVRLRMHAVFVATPRKMETNFVALEIFSFHTSLDEILRVLAHFVKRNAHATFGCCRTYIQL